MTVTRAATTATAAVVVKWEPTNYSWRPTSLFCALVFAIRDRCHLTDECGCLLLVAREAANPRRCRCCGRRRWATVPVVAPGGH
ncbi:hypothetical protein C0Q70_04074 [Pomacea canaliculata]|uniref:Uncharacterized protein n=1 Tax=Pomacea canaliculata TaxID=400727 RepID=A0A2T7PUI5_POMCA|nr:hypothetical protein C0Q70_04074 [Pomacea canaliculata]